MQIENKEQRYTLRDYLTWDDGERWELIDGIAYAMAPAPTLAHQNLSVSIASKLWNYLEGKSCQVFTSPIDVVFTDDTDTKNIVQPDIVVVCDPTKLRGGKRVIGAPDIVVEILSPSTAIHDFTLKLKLYEREGVPEYWIVSPEEKAISQNLLKDGKYEAKTYYEGVMQSSRLEDFTLDIKALFDSLSTLPE